MIVKVESSQGVADAMIDQINDDMIVSESDDRSSVIEPLSRIGSKYTFADGTYHSPSHCLHFLVLVIMVIYKI